MAAAPVVNLSVLTANGIDLSWSTLYNQMANSEVLAGGTATEFTVVDTGHFNGQTANLKFVVNGTGFTYSGTDVTGGTITGITVTDGSDVTLATFSGFDIAISDFLSALDTYSNGHEPAPAGDNTPDPSALDAIFNSYAYNGVGNAGNDILQGGDQGNTFSGGDGNDAFFGGDGIDNFDGGAGSNRVVYQENSSGLTVDLSNPANNTGQAAGDTYTNIQNISGSQFADILRGDANDNFLRGNGGADQLDGGAGSDWADYHSPFATQGVTASLADPNINTGAAFGDTYISIENITGTNFNDTLFGDSGDNILMGNGGIDTLVGGPGADTLNGGPGGDRASYQNATAAVTADLQNSGSNTGDAAGDVYVSIEGLRASSHGDILRGDGNDNLLYSGAGADTFVGRGGRDAVLYTFAAGAVTADLADPSQNTGEATGDTYNSIENLWGSAFDDTLIGDGNNNFLFGRQGADHLVGGGGNNDWAAYNSAFVTQAVTASLSDPSINTGDAAGDTYDGIRSLEGTDFDDHLIGDGQNNFLRGAGGADILDGHAGNNNWADYHSAQGLVIDLADPTQNTGDAAGDTYIDIRSLAGSAFDDTIIGDAQNNFLRGNGGADYLDGGAGNDFADYFNASGPIVADLADPSQNTGDAAGDIYVSIESLRGGSGDDILRGDNTTNLFYGGSNVLEGGAGADVLDGRGGFDWASYNTATVGVTASLADASVNTGDAAGDSYISIEGLIGSQLDDTLIGDGGDNFLRGQEGADHLVGGAGSDTADYYETNPSTLSGVTADLSNSANNTGIAAGDTYDSIENLRGTIFDDVLTGDANDNIIKGSFGDDMLTGNGGADTFVWAQHVVGDDGTDTITDFTAAEGDKIDLSGTNITDFSQLDISQNGADAAITLGSGLVLQNVDSTTLNANDFIFAAAAPATVVDITVVTDAGFDFIGQDIIQQLADATEVSETATAITLVNGVYKFVIDGNGLTYDGNGDVSGGTVTGLHVLASSDDTPLVDITGCRISLRPICRRRWSPCTTATAASSMRSVRRGRSTSPALPGPTASVPQVTTTRSPAATPTTRSTAVMATTPSVAAMDSIR